MKNLILALGIGGCLSGMVNAEVRMSSEEEMIRRMIAPERDALPINNENVVERIVGNTNTNDFFYNGNRGNFLRNSRNRFNNVNRNIVTPNIVRDTAIADVNFDRRTNTIDRLIAAGEGSFSRLYEPTFAVVQVAAGGGGNWPPNRNNFLRRIEERDRREEELSRIRLLQENRERDRQRAYLPNLLSSSIGRWLPLDTGHIELTVPERNNNLFARITRNFPAFELPPLESLILSTRERIADIEANMPFLISTSFVFPIPRNFFRIEGNFPIVERNAELQNQARARQLFAPFLNARTDTSEQ